jgi:hypothetical protein
MLIEAESFSDLGGWVVDQQSMDVMGSPYVLAHGLGRPVADARTTIAAPGLWRLFVRTRDWVAPHGPGAFQVLIDGRPVPMVFGVGGDGAWRWHDGGTVALGATSELALHDLTGFAGRCDALLFAPPDAPPPPEGGPELAAFRRACRGVVAAREPGPYDLVVAGGGYAGVCAAITAARHGLRVALIHDRPVLGGNASSEVRVGPIGGTDLPPFPRNGDVVRELAGDIAMSGGVRSTLNDDHVLAKVRAEANVDLHLETHLSGVELADGAIRAVTAVHIRSGAELRFIAPLFADCTGDGTLGVLAGASFRMGREGRDETGESFAPAQADRRVLGTTNFWRAAHTGAPAGFPACPWALPIRSDADWEVSPPKWPAKPGALAFVGGWNWESGFDCDTVADVEGIRDHNLRAIYGTWDWLKNRSPRRAEFADAQLEWIGHIAGKRESRRLLGDLVLTQQDIEEGRVHADGCVTATWYFDMHFPHPDNARVFPGAAFRSLAFDDPAWERLRGDTPGEYRQIRPYPIPYRCLYSRDVPNLFMAGRNISVTHVALAPVRTMQTTGMMGTVVGRAAALCRRLDIRPRALAGPQLPALLAQLAEPARDPMRR